MLSRVLKLLGSDTSSAERRQHLEEAEECIRSVVDHVPDGIITIDAQGTIETFNPAAERIFAYERAEVIGRNVSVLMPEPDRSRHDSYIANYLSTGRARMIGQRGREVTGQRKDGTTFPIELAISEFHVGSKRYFTGIIRDITERKALERELHYRLKQLAEADQKKDQFMGLLGHDLRNPLAPLSNGLQILKRTTASTDRRERGAVAIMERQLGHMVRLIDDLLDVSRISSGKIELRHEVVDLIGAVQHVIDAVRADVESKDQRLVTAFAKDHIYIEADPTRIGQIVMNLLKNASKYSDSGTEIVVAVDEYEGRARLSIRDQGIGIAAEQLPRIFDMFVQVEASSERRQGGLGLGLTLVKRLTELHGGSVAAYSEGPGKGSEFVVELPLLADRRGVQKDAPATTTAANETRRIVVIDDNQDAADMLAAILSEKGHMVTALYTGESAVEEVLRQSPDIVICDIGMPGVSGLDVARQLRLVFGDRKLTLIAVTGYGRPEDAASAKSAGFDVHLVKPVDVQTLEAAITEALK